MKRSIFLCLLITLLLIMFISCDWKGHSSVMKSERALFFNDDTKIAEDLTEEIIRCINSKDYVSLKKLFSEKAQNSIDNFDLQTQELESFLNGSVTLEEWDKAVSARTEYKDGNISKMLTYSFTLLLTGNETYTCFVVDYCNDSITPNNEGLYMLEFAKIDYDDYKPLEERLVPGISILSGEKGTVDNSSFTEM
ncbi:MAG: DUF5104 domain-containing protein [Clostridia bacterium]|nr:DUF5104 domain-containing protein [Clostridia bacterium]